MSLVSRKGLEFIINQIGKAKYAFKDLVGDLYLNRGYFLKLICIINFNNRPPILNCFNNEFIL